MPQPRRILPSDTLENGFRVAHNETVDAMPDYTRCKVTDEGLLQFYNDEGSEGVFLGEIDLSTVFRKISDASGDGGLTQFFSASETEEGLGKIATADEVAAGQNQHDWVTPATLDYAFSLLKQELIDEVTSAGIPTLDQVARQEYQQDTNDIVGFWGVVEEPIGGGQGVNRLLRPLTNFERALQYLFTGRSDDLMAGIAGLLLRWYQSDPARGASFMRLALSSVQYAASTSRLIAPVFEVENGQYVLRGLTPAQQSQQVLDAIDPVRWAEKLAPALSGGAVKLNRVVSRCEVQIPVPAPTSQKIMLTGATDGQTVPHALETDQILFRGAYSKNDAGVYQLDNTVTITNPTNTSFALYSPNGPFTGRIDIANATV